MGVVPFGSPESKCYQVRSVGTARPRPNWPQRLGVVTRLSLLSSFQYCGASNRKPSIIAKCFRFLLTSVQFCSIAVAAIRESNVRKPSDYAYRLSNSIRTLAKRGVNANHAIRRYERIDGVQVTLVSCPNDQFLGGDDRDRRVTQSIKVAGSH